MLGFDISGDHNKAQLTGAECTIITDSSHYIFQNARVRFIPNVTTQNYDKTHLLAQN